MIMVNSTHQQPAQPFPLFPQLPVELQRRIWELCLPARIVELDLQGAGIVPTSCILQSTSQINRRIPLALRICRESRSVALLTGATKLYDDDCKHSDAPKWEALNDIRDLWVTPLTDVLHLNCNYPYDGGWYNFCGKPLLLLLWLARQNCHYTCMSIVAPLVL